MKLRWCAMVGMVILASAGTVPAGAAGHPDAVFGVWRNGELLVKAAESPVELQGLKEGDEVILTVGAAGLETARVAEIHFFYDAAGLEHKGWMSGKDFQGALTLTPTEDDDNRLVMMVAMPRPVTFPPDRPLEIASVHFVVRDPAHARAGIGYMEILDADYGSETRGIKPETKTAARPAKPPLEKRELGDGVWWSVARPNPFAKHISLTFNTPDTAWVEINVIDKKGKLVRPLVANSYKGRYQTNWMGTNFAAERVKYGEYTITFESAGKVDSQLVRFVAAGDTVAPADTAATAEKR